MEPSSPTPPNRPRRRRLARAAEDEMLVREKMSDVERMEAKDAAVARTTYAAAPRVS